MAEPSTIIFPIEKPTLKVHNHAIKWSVGAMKYEIHSPLLNLFELSEVLPHCIFIRDLVRAAVGNQAHLGSSLFKVMPRTLATPLRTVWDRTLVDWCADNDSAAEDAAAFDAVTKRFIGAHSVEDDSHDLSAIADVSQAEESAGADLLLSIAGVEQLHQLATWSKSTFG